MSLEKGINRIGTTSGVILGAYISILIIKSTLESSEFDNFSIGQYFILLLLIFIFFLIGFGIMKAVTNTLNWIIKGFRE